MVIVVRLKRVGYYVVVIVVKIVFRVLNACQISFTISLVRISDYKSMSGQICLFMHIRRLIEWRSGSISTTEQYGGESTFHGNKLFIKSLLT